MLSHRIEKMKRKIRLLQKMEFFMVQSLLELRKQKIVELSFGKAEVICIGRLVFINGLFGQSCRRS